LGFLGEEVVLMLPYGVLEPPEPEREDLVVVERLKVEVVEEVA
jgi:hypothetical protein